MAFEAPAAGAYHGIAWGDRYVIAGDAEATVHAADGQLLSSVALQGTVGHGVSGDTAYLGLLEGKCARALLRFSEGVEATPPGMFDDPYAGGAFAWVGWPYAEVDTDGAMVSDDAADTSDGPARGSGADGVDAGAASADGAEVGGGGADPATGEGVSTPWPAWSALLLLALAKRRRSAPAF